MSGISDSATVTLNINGAQAKRMMADLEKQIKSTEESIKRMKAAGADPKKVLKAQNELKSYRRQLDEMRSATEGVTRAMEALDKATPRQLEKSLRTLNRDLKDMTPGTKTWQSHIDKIQQLQARLRQLRIQVQGQESLWKRFSKWWYDSGQAVAAMVAGYSTVVSTLRRYVDDFAGMAEEMANTRKFTGMAKEEVAELNEEFRNMDTRSGREQLNRLAQEAGRLGKSSLDDVMGFVKAADIINVALDELGDGATLEISKLTDIFRLDEKYGTYGSMMKASSVINDLSQSCTASAPYIVEFTKRMAGVGAQARMTVPEIMAIGATMDTLGSNVEMSATAISQSIMKLFQKPAEIAKALGMDAKLFTKTLADDTTQGLLMFLEAVNRVGGGEKGQGMVALAPLFKDLQLDGARMSQVLGGAAQKVDDLRARIDEANSSFEKGTSTLNEFNIFNNTAQASLDKAKKRFHELSVELGERLFPLITGFISSSSAAVRALMTAMNFFSSYKTEIVTLSAAVAAYTVAVAAVSVKQAVLNKLMAFGTKAGNALAGMFKIMNVGAVAFRNSVDYLRNGMETTHAMQERWRKAMAVMDWKAWTAGVLALAAAVVYLGRKLYETFSVQKTFSEVFKKANEAVASQIREVNELTRVIHDHNRTNRERVRAIAELKNLIPGYLAYLTREGDIVRENTKAVDTYIGKLRQQARVEAARQKLVELEKERLDIEVDNETLKQLSGTDAALSLASTAANPILAPLQYVARKAVEGGVNAAKLEGNRRRTEALEAYIAGAELENTQERAVDDMIMVNKELYARSKSYKEQVDMLKAQLLADEKTMSRNEAAQKYNDRLYNLNYRYELIGAPSDAGQNGDGNEGPRSFEPYVSQKQLEKEAKKSALEAKRALAKANAAYKAAMEKAKAEWESAAADNVVGYASGAKDYRAYIEEKERLDLKYVDDRIKVYESLYENESREERALLLKYDEDYRELLLKRAETERKQSEESANRSVSRLKKEYETMLAYKKAEFSDPGSVLYQNEAAQEEALYQLKISYLTKYRDSYKLNSKEWAEYEARIEDEEQNRMLEKRARLNELVAKWRHSKEKGVIEATYRMEMALLDEAFARKMITEEEYQKWMEKLSTRHGRQTSADKKRRGYMVEIAGTDGETESVDTRSARELQADAFNAIATGRDDAVNALKELYEAGEISEQEYHDRCAHIRKSATEKMLEAVRSSLDPQTAMLFDLGEAWYSLFDSILNEGTFSFESLSDVASSTVASLCAGLEMYGEFVKAQSQIEVAQTEKKYDAEIKAAQGNTYKTARLEKKKEQDVTRIKADATRKEFTVKVLEAIAQTAQNAVIAYGSLAGIPIVGPALGAAAAAAATALGMVQVALIRKQQQASQAQGYSRGGFTRPGPVDEPAGIVHAGEWVASQRLLSNPVARPLIEALDYAQRTNTIGMLRGEDVSRSITAPDSLVRLSETDAGQALLAGAASRLARTVDTLTDRLKEPFVTVNTVEGDQGIKQAQDRYRKLMDNKKRKSRLD